MEAMDRRTTRVHEHIDPSERSVARSDTPLTCAQQHIVKKKTQRHVDSSSENCMRRGRAAFVRERSRAPLRRREPLCARVLRWVDRASTTPAKECRGGYRAGSVHVTDEERHRSSASCTRALGADRAVWRQHSTRRALSLSVHPRSCTRALRRAARCTRGTRRRGCSAPASKRFLRSTSPTHRSRRRC